MSVADRLWIQRVPPKPPRARNLKRKRPATTPKQPARPKVVEDSSDDEDEERPARSKRKRLQSQSKQSAKPKANGRATRASRRAAQSSNADADLILPGKSTRAAKVQANKKLDVQAKELAEFQRQAARLASAKSRANGSPRKSRGASSSPSKRAVGTRISARLRNSNRADAADDEDDEWQQVPEEWLQESASPEPRSSRARTRSKGKQKAESEGEPEEDDAELDAEEPANAVGDGDEGEEPKDDDGGAEAADDTVERDDLLQKAGLESGSVSDLTDLSDQEGSDAAEDDEPPARRQRARRGGRRKSARTTRSTRRAKAQLEEASPSKSKSKPDAQTEPEEEEDQEMEEPAAPLVPEDFVEWEAVRYSLALFVQSTDRCSQIAVTLAEWEQVAEPFAKATHYLEKALYKMLSLNIVPIVTADLRVRVLHVVLIHPHSPFLSTNRRRRRESVWKRRSCIASALLASP